MVWKPNVTVAAIAERAGEFLMVEERTNDGLKINQPAGHLEPEESLIEASVREALEETAYDFVPEYLVGVYRWRKSGTKTIYLRFAFAGRVGELHAGRELDKSIVRPLWLKADEIKSTRERHRSPLVLRCLEDYLQGARYPLALLVHFD